MDRLQNTIPLFSIDLVVVLLLCCTVSVHAQARTVDDAEVERVEELSESLANQLHELSLAVRDRDFTAISGHLSSDLEATPWPAPDGDAVAQTRWTARANSLLPTQSVGRGEFDASWKAYLDDFSSIEDVRFKVKAADFSETGELRADALIAIAIVGRTGSGKRAWVEAKAHVQAIRSDRWTIDRFEFASFSARVVTAELFSEIALPAGVYHAAPPFGTPGNPSFIAHGVAVADVDADGLLDAFTTAQVGNFLYLNEGDGTFREAAEAAGIKITPTASAPLFVDVDNDGDSDLFLASSGHQVLFENRLVPDGEMRFSDISSSAGVDHLAQGFSAVSTDVNGDGLPDIYVASYNRYGFIMPNSWSHATNGTPNLLFINQGGNRFIEQARQWGVADSRWSYAAHFGDLDDDGDQDLYVANDFGENALFLNEGDRFVDAASRLAMLDPGNGMGVTFGDYDNDGHIDVHVTNMSSTAGKRILKRLFPDEASHFDQTRGLGKLAAGNTLFRNLGGGKFFDVTSEVGPFTAGWAWGGGFVDFDNDGWLDIHSPNGFVSGKSLKDT